MTNSSMPTLAEFRELDSDLTANFALFQDVISRLPGGSYIGEQWRTEPRVLIVIDNSGEDLPVFKTCREAFRSHRIHLNSWRHRWVAVAPAIVGTLIEQRCDLDDELYVEVFLLDSSGLGSTVWVPTLAEMDEAEMLTAVAYCLSDESHGSTEDGLQVADEICELANDLKVPWTAAFELAGPPSEVNLEQLEATLSVAFAAAA